jgi:hypothetical protein
MAADQCAVPAAVPEDPVLVDQVTLATPTLSVAVPANASDDELVETLVPPGEVMVSEGGVVSPPVGLDGGAGVGVGGGFGFGLGVGVGVGVGAGAGAGVGEAGGVGLAACAGG